MLPLMYNCWFTSFMPSQQDFLELRVWASYSRVGRLLDAKTQDVEPNGLSFKTLPCHLLALRLCQRPVPPPPNPFSPSSILIEPLDFSWARGHWELTIICPSLLCSKVWACDQVLANGDVGRRDVCNFLGGVLKLRGPALHQPFS